MNPYARYKQTAQATASKERLMVMLFEAALRHMRVGATALEEGRKQDAREPLGKAGDIVVELMATLDTAQAPELCEQLAAVYQFVSARLLMAQVRQSAPEVREAERAFAPLVEAFGQAVAQLPQEAR